MKRLIIIRGPAAVGKTTVSWKLRNEIKKAVVIDIDYLCHTFGGTPIEDKDRHFAYNMIYHMVQPILEKGWDIILERIFMEQEDLDKIFELFEKSGYQKHMFSLEDSLENITEKDKQRESYKVLGKKFTEEIYRAYNKLRISQKETKILVSDKSVDAVSHEILEVLKTSKKT